MSAQNTPRQYLESRGFVIGERDPRINRRYRGAYMVAEAHDKSELPTDDGRNGPWCIVGDDLEALITQAYEVWYDGSEEEERANV